MKALVNHFIGGKKVKKCVEKIDKQSLPTKMSL